MKFGVIDFIWASLQVAFIVLKLCGVIDWSWWLVLVPVLFVLLFSILCFVTVLCIKFYVERRDRSMNVELMLVDDSVSYEQVKQMNERAAAACIEEYNKNRFKRYGW